MAPGKDSKEHARRRFSDTSLHLPTADTKMSLRCR